MRTSSSRSPATGARPGSRRRSASQLAAARHDRNSGGTPMRSRSGFDTLTLPDGTTVRRVVVKAPVTAGTPRPGASGSPRPRREDTSAPVAGRHRPCRGGRAAPLGRGRPGPAIVGPPPAGTCERFSLPNFYLQCRLGHEPGQPACCREHLAERDEQLADIDERDRTEHRRPPGRPSRGRSSAPWPPPCSAAGCWSASACSRSSGSPYAVSQISPKDFRLPIDPQSLPAEVNPVADRLSQAPDQLQAAFEREKRAAADISHELRTPLGGPDHDHRSRLPQAANARAVPADARRLPGHRQADEPARRADAGAGLDRRRGGSRSGRRRSRSATWSAGSRPSPSRLPKCRG